MSEKTPTPEPATPEPPKPEPSKPEPPKPDTSAYNSIIEQQTKQIEALIKQNENLTAQVTKMIETGAQIRDEGAGKADPEPSLGENFNRPEIEARDDKDDFTVDYLGKFIGGKHN